MLLNATGLYMSFDGRRVLSGASLEVQSGETVAVVGPSGSGKTTLLSVCGLLLRADSGSVRIDGQEVNRMSQLRPGAIGWVLQQSNSFLRRTVLDNVAIGSLAAGFSHAESHRLSERALTEVGLSGRLHSEARQLSGGELQRMCVARSIAARPKLILADEPTGGLDEENSRQIASVLRRASSSGVAVVVATHDVALAQACHRVVEMYMGRLHIEESQ